MITPFVHESFLPCNVSEINYEYCFCEVINEDFEKLVVLDSDISVVECTSNYLLINHNEVYAIEDLLVIDFIEKINKYSIKYSELNKQDREICKNLLYNEVCKLDHNYTVKKIRKIEFPNYFKQENVIKSFGWFPSIPLLLEIDVTNKCNQKCIHCYQESSEKHKITGDMLSLLRKWCVEAGNEGIPYIRFLGGEPFIIPGLLDICEEAKLAGVVDFQISTNGTLINDRDIHRMKKIFKQIQVSLLSSNSDEHDEIVGLNGSFKKATMNIKKLIDSGIKVNANFVVMKQNYHRIEEIADMMFEYGGSVRYLALFLDGRAKDMLSISDYEKDIIIKSISNVMMKYSGRMKINTAGIPIIRNIPTSSSFYGCPAGRTVMRLSVEKQIVAPCTRECGQSYKDNSICDIWYEDFMMKYRVRPSCDCDYTDFCGGPCVTEVKRLGLYC